MRSVLLVSEQCAACVCTVCCACAVRLCTVCVSPLSKLYMAHISCHSPLGEVSLLPVTSGLEEWSDSVDRLAGTHYLFSLGWLLALEPPASSSPVLGLQECTTMPNLLIYFKSNFLTL